MSALHKRKIKSTKIRDRNLLDDLIQRYKGTCEMNSVPRGCPKSEVVVVHLCCCPVQAC